MTEKAEKKEKKSKRTSESDLVERYPNTNILAGSLRFLEGENKQAVTIVCGCGTEREVRTSDLFQVSTCAECKKAAKKAARATKKEEKAKEAKEEAPEEVEAELADLVEA